MTTQETEFNAQIDKIGELYENIKDALHSGAYGNGIPDEAYTQLSELRDIACMRVKQIHQPNEN